MGFEAQFKFVIRYIQLMIKVPHAYLRSALCTPPIPASKMGTCQLYSILPETRSMALRSTFQKLISAGAAGKLGHG